MTREEIIEAIGDCEIETDKHRVRMAALRRKRVELILKLHGLEIDKTVVRLTDKGAPSLFGIEFIVCDADMRATFGIERKPHIMGRMMRKAGGFGTRVYPLKTNWEIVTAEELAMERV